MDNKTELELLETINNMPEPPIFGMLIVENGMVKLKKEIIDYYKCLDIRLKEIEPIEKVEKLCKKLKSTKFLMVEVI